MIKNASSPKFGVDPDVLCTRTVFSSFPKHLTPVLRWRTGVKWWAGKDSNLRTLT